MVKTHDDGNTIVSNTNHNNNNDISATRKKSQHIGLIIVSITVVIVMIVGSGLISSRNSMNTARNQVKADWSQVENVMQRRNDLIPNLVASVKGQMKHESDVFKAIAESRKMYDNADTPNDKLSADEELRSNTNVLLNAVQENYPDLASSQSVQTLMTQLEGNENRISTERRRYIASVQDYNNLVTSFPNSMFAGMFGFSRMEEYHADPSVSKVPQVDFSDE